MRFDRTRPRVLQTSTLLLGRAPPRLTPCARSSLQAGLCRIPGRAGVPPTAPPGADSAGGAPSPSLPGHLRVRLPRWAKPVHSPNPFLLLAGKPAARRGRGHGGSGVFMPGTARPDERLPQCTKDHPPLEPRQRLPTPNTHLLRFALAHSLSLKTSKLSGARRAPRTQAAASRSTLSVKTSAPCFSLGTPWEGKLGRQEEAVGMGKVLSGRRFQG